MPILIKYIYWLTLPYKTTVANTIRLTKNYLKIFRPPDNKIRCLASETP